MSLWTSSLGIKTDLVSDCVTLLCLYSCNELGLQLTYRSRVACDGLPDWIFADLVPVNITLNHVLHRKCLSPSVCRGLGAGNIILHSEA